MINLALQTEFSFKTCFMPIGDVHKYVVDGHVGIADLNSTYGHIALQKEAEKHGFNPIFGVRLFVLPTDSKQRVSANPWVFIAKNNEGLVEINKLVETAHKNFYYIPKLDHNDIDNISSNVIIVATSANQESDPDYYATGQGFNYVNKRCSPLAIPTNSYPTLADKEVYELMAGSRKHGAGYVHQFNDSTYPMHILNEQEFALEYGAEGIAQTYKVASECEARIPKAEMVKWDGSHDLLAAMDLDKVKEWSPIYDKRLAYEMKLIKEKNYVDYFLIVADLINHCKKKMLVGPSRGSSAGSLVCYLLGITEVDPVVHNLIFERFIDINRHDLPDIDIDFPDIKREIAVKYLKKKYGEDHVMCLANINRLKGRSAIAEFAKGLNIPPYETDAVKDALIERKGGDERANFCIADTLETTDQGKELIEKHPKMALAGRVENHASHAGKHAAGILVATLPLSSYGSMNPRDEVIMMDKRQASYLGLLKIDCLGLRTLSILESVAEQLNKPFDFFYKLEVDDRKVYDLFNSQRLSGIFQFEGQALQAIVKKMGVNNFNDISAITALARPNALNSGGTARYIRRSIGEEEPSYYGDTHHDITGDTLGIIIYQEQMMQLAREVGGMSWSDVQMLRKAASGSMGDSFFGKYKNEFVNGAIENGYSELDSEQLWGDIAASGSYGFNKSHAVSYGLVSYWTAWCKAYHPMEFAVASLNHAASNDNAIRLLRDLVKNDGLSYTPIDSDSSGLYWSVSGDKLLGGLVNIKGIGIAKAKQILRAREGGKLTPSLFKHLMNPETDFDILFPAEHYWGMLYNDPSSHGLDTKPVVISEVDAIGEYVFIGCLIDKNIRDINERNIVDGKELLESDNLYLTFRLEDDTDSVNCKIAPHFYDSLGRDIAERGKVGNTWYLVRGKIYSDWRRVDVFEIIDLNRYFNVKVK